MNSLRDRKFRFADAAFAIDTNPRTLRNWMQRNELDLTSEYSGRNWTEFNLADIAILSIMRALIRWGLGVEDANRIAMVSFMQVGRHLLQYDETPATALVAALDKATLYVHSPDEDFGPVMSVGTEVADRPEQSSILSVDLSLVVMSAFQRIGVARLEYDSDYRELLDAIKRLHQSIRSSTESAQEQLDRMRKERGEEPPS